MICVDVTEIDKSQERPIRESEPKISEQFKFIVYNLLHTCLVKYHLTRVCSFSEFCTFQIKLLVCLCLCCSFLFSLNFVLIGESDKNKVSHWSVTKTKTKTSSKYWQPNKLKITKILKTSTTQSQPPNKWWCLWFTLSYTLYYFRSIQILHFLQWLQRLQSQS